MPKIVKHDLVRKKILNNAVKVFNEKGYKNTRVADITDSGKMSRTMFYQYYKNKEDVFNEVGKNIQNMEDPKEVMDFILNFDNHSFTEEKQKLEEEIKDAKKNICENYFMTMFVEDDGYPNEDNISHDTSVHILGD